MNTLQALIDSKKHKEVITIAPNRPVFDALVIMAEYRIGALVVVENEKMVGIFSERDYAREVILKGRHSKTTHITDVMTHNVIAAEPHDTPEHALTTMTSNNFRHLPVVDNGKLVGILSLGDVAKVIISKQQELIKQLENAVRK